MIFYTADPHFESETIIQNAARPFSSVQEMDEELIRRWNAAVSDEDTVYVLGDVGSYCKPFPARQVSRLRGHKHLIRGNHDMVLADQQLLLEHFETVTDYLEIQDGGVRVTLCHYPIVYNQCGYMIHGHIHNIKKEIFCALTQLPRVLNAGVDLNHFEPVTLDRLIRNNREFYQDPMRGCLPEREDGKPRRQQKWQADFQLLPVRKIDLDRED